MHRIWLSLQLFLFLFPSLDLYFTMIKSIANRATIMSLIFSVLAAGQILGTPEVWCALWACCCCLWKLWWYIGWYHKSELFVCHRYDLELHWRKWECLDPVGTLLNQLKSLLTSCRLVPGTIIQPIPKCLIAWLYLWGSLVLVEASI